MAQELSEKTRTLVRSRIVGYEKLDPTEAAREAIKVIAKDFYIYCERNLMIKDKLTRQIVPFELNWAQKLLVELVLKDIQAGLPVRYIILKARQMGLSTVIEAICFWWTTTHRNVNSVIIAHESDASSNLYKMFRRYYDNCNPTFKPDRKYNTKKDLVFDVEDNIKKQHIDAGERSPGLGSEIKTMVAKEGKGRSDTINFFHGSEVAFWEDSADVISGALQAVPMSAETFAFLESTANGVGGYFYDEWQFAKKGESTFKPIFFAWHEHPEYELSSTTQLIYDEEEEELIDIFKEKQYPIESWDRKIIWRREKKKEFRSDPAKFYQEYPKDDMEAFLASGRPVFDTRQLQKMENYAQNNLEHIYGNIIKVENQSGKSTYEFRQVAQRIEGEDPTPLKLWHLPEKDQKYTLAVDVAEGIEINSESGKKNDFCVIEVMDSKLRTCLRWRGHIDPDMLGEIAFNIGMFYNTALIGVEVNNHGLTTVQSLRNKFYRNLYMREQAEDQQFQQRTSKMGWLTSKRTKPIIINELVKAIRDGDIIDLDIVFIRECMTYVRDDRGFTNAREGMFDDTVMAKAINLHLAQWNSYDTEYAKESIHKPTKRNINAENNTNSIESIAAGKPARNRNHLEAVARRRQARSRHRTSRRQR